MKQSKERVGINTSVDISVDMDQWFIDLRISPVFVSHTRAKSAKELVH